MTASSAHRRGDGRGDVRDHTPWGELFRDLLRERDSTIVRFVTDGPEELLWQPFVREPIIGSKAIAYFPADDFWYHGRCVSGKMFENKCVASCL